MGWWAVEGGAGLMAVEDELPGEWLAMSVQILDDEKIEELIEEQGHVAFTIVVALLCQAKIQKRGGVVERTFKKIAADAHTDPEQVRKVVPAAAEVGFLRVVEETTRGVVVEIKGWRKWQERFRQARSRANRKSASDEASGVVVTDSHDESRDVEKRHLTEQDKTEQNKDKTEESSGVTPSDAPLSHLLADLVAENDPNGKRPTVTKRWATEEGRMLRIDGRKPAEAERLIRWTQGNSFWRGNILSMPKFREKYGQLHANAVKDAEQKRRRDPAPGMTQAEKRAAEIQRKQETRAAA